MPDTFQDAVYILMTAVISLGVIIIGWLVNKGFQAVIGHIKSLGVGLHDLSTEIRKEREARIRSGARLWGEFISMQRLCATRHGAPVPETNPDFEHLEKDD